MYAFSQTCTYMKTYACTHVYKKTAYSWVYTSPVLAAYAEPEILLRYVIIIILYEIAQ